MTLVSSVKRLQPGLHKVPLSQKTEQCRLKSAGQGPRDVAALFLLSLLCFFIFIFFRLGFLCVVLAVLELALSTRLSCFCLLCFLCVQMCVCICVYTLSNLWHTYVYSILCAYVWGGQSSCSFNDSPSNLRQGLLSLAEPGTHSF